ncbi:MAG: quinone oxidoreductase [Candidatus Protochlamydia sp.]|nr:quinone oxidoreductase [Candidatus Protochlamydia sp.]
MKAVQIFQYGGPEVLELQEVQAKKPGKDQALIRVEAAGVNFIDVYQRRGIYPVELPYIPGLEASGVVEAIGEGVNNVKPGDRVAYVHEPGSYAELALVKAEHLIPLPAELSFEQGAAFPLQGMTAHYLIHEFRKIKLGDIVLIHAAAGGMGLILVQWAKHLGAHVLGTVSTEEKAKIAKEAGADEVILYTKHEFSTEVKRLTKGHGADLIIDGVGKTTFNGNLEAAAFRGNIVIFGAASGPADPILPNVLMKHSLTISGGSLSNYLLNKADLQNRSKAVLEGIQQGWLKLKINSFPLEKAAEAHQELEERKTSGKLVLMTRR